MVETAFSSIKRMFGEHTSAAKFQNMVKEMVMKGSITCLVGKYKSDGNNLWIRVMQ